MCVLCRTADTLKKSIVTCNSEAMIREKVAPHPSSGLQHWVVGGVVGVWVGCGWS